MIQRKEPGKAKIFILWYQARNQDAGKRKSKGLEAVEPGRLRREQGGWGTVSVGEWEEGVHFHL